MYVSAFWHWLGQHYQLPTKAAAISSRPCVSSLELLPAICCCWSLSLPLGGSSLLYVYQYLYGYFTARTLKFSSAVKKFSYQFQTTLLRNSSIFVTDFDMVLSWSDKGFSFLLHQWISPVNYKSDGTTSDEIGNYYLIG